MLRLDDTLRFARRTLALGCALSLSFSVTGCGKGGAAETIAKNGDVVTAKNRISTCALMSKEEVNALTGNSYTVAEANDDGHSSSSDCHYSSPTDPAGASISVQWIAATDYSSPAEHAALQHAGLTGAKLGGRLGESMVPSNDSGGPMHMPSGPVEGVGDEATTSMLLLTARRGDYTVMVQLFPTDMMALATDRNAATALVEKEKAIARKLFTKL